ncbi:F-box/kelch-repeat protein At3g17530-like [Brachypodium distachyon]|uniref:F-box/kelch-repeat protein At3g17530-like n=1 Tax=Brachypodium distachyon TaxID=15368 RepID=UPI00052FE6EC|nr:F-box/kelch-repeat protein At3g17530-like [Brachypodium distachyon]|eukprot:XP_024316374.1 F-box/kelch-repeat protein At3g17530-like [Brachypodium distachyon]
MFLSVILIAVIAVPTVGFQRSSTSDSTPPATAARTSSPRRRPRLLGTTAEGPLDDDDLLREILLRLPPQPSSLPRTSLVCKRWRGLVSEPGFYHRFRFHRRHNPPPILGCLVDLYNQGKRYISFMSTLDPPNRIPAEWFSLHFNHGDPLRLLGCCHGLVLLFSKTRFEVLVWDPVTGDRHRLAIPPGFYAEGTAITGAVLRVAGDGHHSLVALAVA